MVTQTFEDINETINRVRENISIKVDNGWTRQSTGFLANELKEIIWLNKTLLCLVFNDEYAKDYLCTIELESNQYNTLNLRETEEILSFLEKGNEQLCFWSINCKIGKSVQTNNLLMFQAHSIEEAYNKAKESVKQFHKKCQIEIVSIKPQNIAYLN